MRRLQFRGTIRRLMIGVVILAIPIWGAVMAYRWFDYRRHVQDQEELASVLMQEIEVFKRRSQDARAEGRPVAAAGLESTIKLSRSALVEVLDEAARYRRGMNQPWRSVRWNH